MSIRSESRPAVTGAAPTTGGAPTTVLDVADEGLGRWADSGSCRLEHGIMGPMYGAFLRQVRESRSMSQAQLAEVSGIGQPNISAYENDRRTPSLDVFNRLLVSCGYELAADGGRTVLYAPFPHGAGGYPFDDLPPRLPDDPPDLGLPVRGHLSMRERARVLTSVLESAEAIRAGRSSRSA